MTRPLVIERLLLRGWDGPAEWAFRRDTNGTFAVVRRGATRARIRDDTFAVVWPGATRGVAEVRRDTFTVARPGAKIRRDNRHSIPETPQVLRLRPSGLGHEARTGHPPPAPRAISP
ncbi:hypothetical protein OG943_06355 [Amycolatopsis sp. NBC_00345]|uniref:hypothetical protein n=1 Tax=Amycolatopsis sp. NBC_00345 TaxID=2975955 RepID=UPI002E263048